MHSVIAVFSVSITTTMELIMVKKEPVSVRFDADVLAALQKIATKEERTISFMINRIVRDYLKAKKVLK